MEKIKVARFLWPTVYILSDIEVSFFLYLLMPNPVGFIRQYLEAN